MLSEKNHFSGKGLGMSQAPPSVLSVPYTTSYSSSRHDFEIRRFVPPEFQAYLRYWVTIAEHSGGVSPRCQSFRA